MSLQFIFLRALPVTGRATGGEWEAEWDGARERQAEGEAAEGKGERQGDGGRAIQVLLLRVAASLPGNSHQP